MARAMIAVCRPMSACVDCWQPVDQSPRLLLEVQEELRVKVTVFIYCSIFLFLLRGF